MDTALQQFTSSTLNLFKKEEDGETAPLFAVNKTTVLQEARAFNETPINSRKCRAIITKILWLLYQSESFNTREATDTFFSITKLFQANDVTYSNSYSSKFNFHDFPTLLTLDPWQTEDDTYIYSTQCDSIQVNMQTISSMDTPETRYSLTHFQLFIHTGK